MPSVVNSVAMALLGASLAQVMVRCRFECLHHMDQWNMGAVTCVMSGQSRRLKWRWNVQGAGQT